MTAATDQEILDQFRNQVPILDAYSQCTLCKLPELIGAGVTGLKIVGRCLAAGYQERTTRWYRELIDLIEEGSVDSFQRKLEAIRKEPIYHIILGKNARETVIPITLMESSCIQKRCFYSPLFFTPYKLLPWVPRIGSKVRD